LRTATPSYTGKPEQKIHPVFIGWISLFERKSKSGKQREFFKKAFSFAF